MKKLWVGSRVVQFRNGMMTMEPIGVFTDRADAEKAVGEVPRMIAGAHPGVHNAFALVGIEGITGAVTEVPFVAGAGLTITDQMPSDDRPVVGLFSKE